MVKVNYKNIPHGKRFIFEGKEYTKTNHKRGYYFESGRKVFRRFKNLKVVESESSLWDFVPPLK